MDIKFRTEIRPCGHFVLDRYHPPPSSLLSAGFDTVLSLHTKIDLNIWGQVDRWTGGQVDTLLDPP